MNTAKLPVNCIRFLHFGLASLSSTLKIAEKLYFCENNIEPMNYDVETLHSGTPKDF